MRSLHGLHVLHCSSSLLVGMCNSSTPRVTTVSDSFPNYPFTSSGSSKNNSSSGADTRRTKASINTINTIEHKYTANDAECQRKSTTLKSPNCGKSMGLHYLDSLVNCICFVPGSKRHA